MQWYGYQASKKTPVEYAESYPKKSYQSSIWTKYNAHTSGLFQSNGITKVENIFERDSLLLTFKYQNKSLPQAIIELYDNSDNMTGNENFQESIKVSCS